MRVPEVSASQVWRERISIKKPIGQIKRIDLTEPTWLVLTVKLRLRYSSTP